MAIWKWSWPIYKLALHTKITIYRTTILSVVLYGPETWSFPMRKGHKLRVSENRVLRK